MNDQEQLSKTLLQIFVISGDDGIQIAELRDTLKEMTSTEYPMGQIMEAIGQEDLSWKITPGGFEFYQDIGMAKLN